MKKTILYILLSFLILSCSKEEETISKTEEPAATDDRFLSLSQQETTVPSNQTEIKLNIRSNVNWEVISKPDWISIQPDEGTGNAEVEISIDENSGTTLREGLIVFESEIAQPTFKIFQESSPLKLVSYSGSEGPIQLSEPKYFLFNKPIQVNYIMSGEERILFNIDENDMEYFDNNHGVKFTGGPSTLGSEHAYKFSVQDSDGNVLEETVNLNFYSQKIVIPGFIKDAILDDAKNLWVLSVQTFLQETPSYIIKYKIEDRSLVEEFRFEVGIDGSDVTYIPGGFCINPFNDLIYVTNPLQNKIEVYNKSGSLVKELSKTGLTITNAIIFLRSGLGIFTGQLNNEGRWLFLDSSQNDEISLPVHHPYFASSFETFVLNHDKSKAYLLGNRSPSFKILDESGDIEEINMKDLYPNGADAVRITQNKLNSKIYVAGLYNQQIIKPDLSFLSKQSYTKFFIGDFSYNPDHSNHIYALTGATSDGVRFKLLDYDNQTTKGEYRINHNFSLGGYPGVITSPDNDIIILYTDRYDNTTRRSQVVVFDTEMFQ